MKILNLLKSYSFNKYFLFIYFLCVLFPFTQLKYIWGFSQYSKAANLILLFLPLLTFFYWIKNDKINKRILYKYIFPCFLIFISSLINISFSVYSNYNNISLVGLLIPMVINLSIPYFYHRKMLNIPSIWAFSYILILLIVTLGLIDYFLIFFSGYSGFPIETPYGLFITGYFSIYHDLGLGIPYYRFYSCFGEPGDLAMWLIPFIIYALHYKKYFGLLILITGFILTFSLGGIISLLIAVCIRILVLKKNKFTILIILLFFGLFMYSGFYSYLEERYIQKGDSATVREDNFKKGIDDVFTIFLNEPLGLELNSSSSENQKLELYSGSNFSPSTYLFRGGFLAFFAYLFFLFFSIHDSFKILLNKHSNSLSIIIAISLICYFPYIFQRMTLWDSVMFSWLFMPILFDFNRKIFLKVD